MKVTEKMVKEAADELVAAEANMAWAERCRHDRHPAADLVSASARLSAAQNRVNKLRRDMARQAASAAGQVFSAGSGGCPQPE